MESLAQCKALNISDEKRCIETATSVNGLFCTFHSRQCQGLYRGYKLRNTRLDKLSDNPPAFLASTKVPLSTQSFAGIETKEVCREVHDHLFLKLQLLDRVIRARKLHHSRFFSMDMDYGHAKFLDILQGQRATIAKALERLEHRAAEVMYKHEQWFNWVRQCQNEEEENRDKEQKKVKQEAALFKRHWKAAEQRMREYRAKEDKKRQNAFLDKIYKERLAEQDTEDDSDMDWDPIEDVLEDNRGNFIDLIQHFLWLSSPVTPASPTPIGDATMKDTPEASPLPAELASSPKIYVPPTIESESADGTPSTETPTKSAKKKNKSKSKSKTPSTSAAATPAPSSGKKPTVTAQPVQEPIPDKSLIETRAEMHERLKNGTEYNQDKIVGLMVAGTMENPIIDTKTVSFPEHQITKLLEEVLEIKHLLFCRLLLGHATLLPVALRSDSVEEFLADPEVTSSTLRDLCLKMERPGLQEIRDACADLFRSDEDEEEEDEDMAETDIKQVEGNDPFDRRILKPRRGKGALPDQWISRRDRNKAKNAQSKNLSELLPNVGGAAVEFRQQKQSKNKKVRVKICGRNIWNYPSDKAMHRGGWLQFCILAKDSRLQDAMELCRHWDEFFELNILAAWHYFPGANWAEWVGNRARQQMLQLGFIMYFQSDKPDAMDLTVRHQSGGRSSQFRRSHAVFEARNFICAHIKRDDQVSRRLVQYLSMQSHRILVLVRDAESGKLLIKPPEDQRWLYREKNGLGRAAKNDWNIIKTIGPVFFEEMDRYRDWHFSFKQYYDVYVWDLEPGECFAHLYNIVQEMLFKAHRIRKGVDIYGPAEYILRTLYRDEGSHRIYHLEAGDQSKHTIWDDLNSDRTRFFYGETSKENREKWNKLLESGEADTIENDNHSSRLFYNQADVLEDAVLFPEEQSSESINPLQIGSIEPIKKWEDEGLSLQAWVNGADLLNSDTEDESEEDSGGDDDEVLEDDDGSSEWEDDDDDEAYSDDGEADPLMAKMLQKFMEEAKSKPDLPEATEESFMTFLDREKARIFKEVWHKADLEPNAQEHYLEMLDMVKSCRKFIQRDDDPKFSDRMTRLHLKIMDALDMPMDLGRDLNKALCKIHPFFYPNFLDSERGTRLKESLLFKQEERAKSPPDVRTHISNKYRSKEFWANLDSETKKMKDKDDLEALPEEWDVTVRPIIAHLFKSGVLRTRADTWHSGQAFAAVESHRPTSDLFIDFRSQKNEIPRGMSTPHSIPDFKPTVSAFTAKNPKARFSILRLWSAAYFYPLMIGPDNHDPTSFRDLVGRNFIWMFVPKDMPCSEYSIHHSASRRIAPYKKWFGDRVVLKRDKFLILGKDMEECMMLTAAVTWCVQTKPWRWEVDLWKSFINVEAGFVEGLDDRWLD